MNEFCFWSATPVASGTMDERSNIFDVFMKLVKIIFSASSAVSSEAGERRIIKGLLSGLIF
jgi:hypothetical protein